jgi:hypothetical protein
MKSFEGDRSPSKQKTQSDYAAEPAPTTPLN